MVQLQVVLLARKLLGSAPLRLVQMAARVLLLVVQATLQVAVSLPVLLRDMRVPELLA